MMRVVLPNLLILSLSVSSFAQSSSLYVSGPDVRQSAMEAQAYGRDGQVSRLSPAIAQTSLVAVPMPEPRRFAVQDLVTVIIREESQAKWASSLDTQKKTNWNAKLEAFPDLKKLLEFTLAPGVSTPVEVDLKYDHKFEGDGDIQRKESMSGRVQARVVDVKPNGTLVLEARKFNQVDDEKLTIVLTGICRAEDITVDNTILSSELYDLSLVKTQEGELRRASKKGFITRLVEFFVNF